MDSKVIKHRNEIKDNISFEESNAIKGLLIFLIILGHNRIFSAVASSQCWMWLYSFHVYSFFLLPFFYPEKGINGDRIRNNAVKLLYVYLIWFIIYSLCYQIMLHIVPSLAKSDTIPTAFQYILAMLTGSQSLLGNTSGFMVLWFLPVMFSMLLIKGLRERFKNSKMWPIVFTFGVICYIMLIDFRYKAPFSYSIISNIDMVSPIAVFRGLGAFAIGYLSFILYEKLKWWGGVAYLLIFLIASTVWFIFSVVDNSLYWILKPLMTVSFFLSIFCFRHYIGKSSLLQTLGKYSMPIYLVHPFLCILFSSEIFNLQVTSDMKGIILVILSQIIITATSYGIVFLIYKLKYLKRFLFPDSYKELFNI